MLLTVADEGDEVSVTDFGARRLWCFTATLVPSERTPLYTLPNPPAQMTRFSSKLFVAKMTSEYDIWRSRLSRGEAELFGVRSAVDLHNVLKAKFATLAPAL
ncbi:hypothetical protein KFK09_016760 [Dendrobium nobile]|uniref:Uncharacterized protein n=1 Tax=Dendrobium nobile TaxID=94219 RepID=A0A8T3B5K3_DENNO|nr:hypothetical protein KFK09_016760 [Dendrobium nobile]